VLYLQHVSNSFNRIKHIFFLALGRSAPTLSSIFAFVSKPFTKSFEQGAATTVYCAASPFVENVKKFIYFFK
jgi:hypothetical protein